jgi:hypothetical protein
MPTPHIRDWIDYLQALAPSIAALVALGVGLTQLHLQRRIANQSLFDKRYTVYKAVGHYLTTVISQVGRTESRTVLAFQRATSHARFLFGQDVLEFLDRVNSETLLLRNIQAQIAAHVNADIEFKRGVPNPEKPDTPMSVLNKSEGDLTSEIIRDERRMNDVFHGYLELHNDKALLVRLEDASSRYFDRWDRTLKSRSQ